MAEIKCSVSSCHYYGKDWVTNNGICTANEIEVNNDCDNTAKTTHETECKTFIPNK